MLRISAQTHRLLPYVDTRNSATILRTQEIQGRAACLCKQADAFETLTEEAKFPVATAVAVAKALDMAIAGADLVTVRIFNERFAASDAKTEARFTQVEARSAALEAKMDIGFKHVERVIDGAKVWAMGLYAALTITLLGALLSSHVWLIDREDRVIGQLQAREDSRLEQVQAREDSRLEQVQARVDSRFEQVQAREDKLIEQLQNLSVTVASIQGTVASIQAAVTRQPASQPRPRP
jgi:hypothetical protein